MAMQPACPKAGLPVRQAGLPAGQAGQREAEIPLNVKFCDRKWKNSLRLGVSAVQTLAVS